MGVIIFTADERPYRVGEYVVMRNGLSCSPTTPETSFILFDDKFNDEDVSALKEFVSYRLVVVTEKLPKLSKDNEESVIVDDSLVVKKPKFDRSITGLLKWNDRKRASTISKSTPLSLIKAFIYCNIPCQIEVGRRLAKTLWLPEIYGRSVCEWGITPSNIDVVWPKSKKALTTDDSTIFRQSDKYGGILSRSDTQIMNYIRLNNPSLLPKGVKKRMESEEIWI